MVFRSNRSGVFELWISNADGPRAWQATHFRGPFVGDPHWSPDGKAIAFTSHASGNLDVFLMRCEQGADTCSEPRRLTEAPETDAVPTWSAERQWIYFSSSRSGHYEVWRMPVGGPLRRSGSHGTAVIWPVSRRTEDGYITRSSRFQLRSGEFPCGPAVLDNSKRSSR